MKIHLEAYIQSIRALHTRASCKAQSCKEIYVFVQYQFHENLSKAYRHHQLWQLCCDTIQQRRRMSDLSTKRQGNQNISVMKDDIFQTVVNDGSA